MCVVHDVKQKSRGTEGAAARDCSPKFSALGVLELLACAGLTWLVTLFLAGIAGDVARLLEDGLVVLVQADQSASDAVPNRRGLRRDAATRHAGLDIELALLRKRDERLHRDDPEDLAREVILERTTVDGHVASAGAQKDARDCVLSLMEHDSQVVYLSWNETGTRLASGALDGEVIVRMSEIEDVLPAWRTSTSGR